MFNIQIGQERSELMYKLFILFMIYSFTGWLMEVIFKLVQNKRLVNRGFLVGPICPIYGVCGSMIYLIFSNIEYNIFMIFFLSIALCAVIEYFVSWLLEYLFDARWWDYSHKKFNINGRICLRNLLFFGLLGCLAVYYINPFLISIINEIDIQVLKIISIILFVLFVIDIIISVKLINSLKDVLYTLKKDATEEISKKIRRILVDKSIYFRRVIIAYPNFKFSLKKIKDKIKRKK